MLSDLRIGILTELHLALVSKTDGCDMIQVLLSMFAIINLLFTDYNAVNGRETKCCKSDRKDQLELQFTYGKKLDFCDFVEQERF